MKMYQDQKPTFRGHDQPENVLRPSETTDEGQMLQVWALSCFLFRSLTRDTGDGLRTANCS
jgi:hypothetical protein